VKKFVSAILLYLVLSLGTFSILAPYVPPPQKAEAIFGMGDIVFDPAAFNQFLEQLIHNAKDYMLQFQQYAQMVKDYEEFIQQTKELVQSTRTLGGLACYAEENLGVNVRGILGQYGLGGLTQTADKIIKGAGVKDLLCDQVGGCIGFGGLLQGGLSGIFSREDTISGVIERYGVKVPTLMVDKLSAVGIIDKQNVLRKFADQACPCIRKLTPEEQLLTEDLLLSHSGSTAVLADADSGVYECPDDPVKPAKAPKSCYNPNNESIVDQVQDDVGDLTPDDSVDDDNIITYNRLTAVLGDSSTKSVSSKGKSDSPGVLADATSCKKSIPPVSDENMGRILSVLHGLGWKVSAEQAAKMIESGVIDPVEILKRYAPTPIPYPTDVAPPLPPCGEGGWLAPEQNSNSGHSTDGFTTHQTPGSLLPPPDENQVCIFVDSSLPGGPGGKSLKLSTNPSEFVLTIFTYILGVIGGIALLLIMLSGYKIMTSRGNPEQIQAGREQLIAAMVGLLFIILSFVIYQVIVIDILRIPGITY
jgi:hypothetical protein